MQVMRINGNVFNLLVMVNCAANFILYSALSTKFRATFSHLFCGCAGPSCWCRPVHTAAGRDVHPDTTAAGRYTSLPGSGRVPAARAGGGRGAAAGRRPMTIAVTWEDDDDDINKAGDRMCSMMNTDDLATSNQATVEQHLHVTHL